MAAPLMERLLPRHMQIIYLINAGISTNCGPTAWRTPENCRPCR